MQFACTVGTKGYSQVAEVLEADDLEHAIRLIWRAACPTVWSRFFVALPNRGSSGEFAAAKRLEVEASDALEVGRECEFFPSICGSTRGHDVNLEHLAKLNTRGGAGAPKAAANGVVRVEQLVLNLFVGTASAEHMERGVASAEHIEGGVTYELQMAK
jgi:hypothetical protein